MINLTKDNAMRIFDRLFRRPIDRSDRIARRDPYSAFTTRDWADLPVHHPLTDER